MLKLLTLQICFDIANKIATPLADAVIETTKILLADDDGHADRIEQFEIENRKLRSQVDRLKKALAALVDIS